MFVNLLNMREVINHFEQNRYVHLARRDVYFERAAELLTAQQLGASRDIRIQDYEGILFLLRTARQHASFSIRTEGKNGADELFFGFINLLVGNVKAVLSIINLKRSVEDSEGFFFSFLGGDYTSVAFQAEEYLCRAKEIDATIHKTLTLAEEPFLQLKEANAAAANEEELGRYNKARGHFSGLVREESRSCSPPPPGFRKILRY